MRYRQYRKVEGWHFQRDERASDTQAVLRWLLGTLAWERCLHELRLTGASSGRDEVAKRREPRDVPDHQRLPAAS